MRDPDRIDRILDKIRDVWHKYPELRLGQLMYVVYRGPRDFLIHEEDDNLERAIDEFIRNDEG